MDFLKYRKRIIHIKNEVTKGCKMTSWNIQTFVAIGWIMKNKKLGRILLCIKL